MASNSEAIETIQPDQLISGRRVSRGRVIAAGLTNIDIDRLVKETQQEKNRYLDGRKYKILLKHLRVRLIRIREHHET